jgi:hypothetical protein
MRSVDIVMFAFKSLMIHKEPATTRVTMSMPNASASTLLVLSGPVVSARWLKRRDQAKCRAPRSEMYLRPRKMSL